MTSPIKTLIIFITPVKKRAESNPIRRPDLLKIYPRKDAIQGKRSEKWGAARTRPPRTFKQIERK